MTYQAVILNFDKKTVQYVSQKDVPKPVKRAVTSTSGSNPPAPRQRET